MTERAYFGTDGIRGKANAFPMTAEIALKVGLAAGKLFMSKDDRRHLVVIGKDTRLSGYMIEPALVAGFAAMGMDVRTFGPVPTPGVAMMTRSMRADLGVMISASHNDYADNGIKLFGPDGYKLSDEIELEIERLMQDDLSDSLAAPSRLGRVKRIDDARHRYVEIVKAVFPKRLSLKGLRIAVDCANGAAYQVAPTALYELGADVFAVGVEPNGMNINAECGSTHPENVSAAVRRHGADVGIALDGDADRVIITDETGHVVDGDQLMALMAARWAAEGRLRHGTLVATVMSNLGLERFLTGHGLRLERTAVGDRYVVEAMRRGGWNLGGEQSGHIVMTDYATTGDGLLAGLHFLSAMVETGQPASALVRQFETVPQMLKNVRYQAGHQPLAAPEVAKVIAGAEQRMGGQGRLLIRKSGTEPLIRVMAECTDETLLRDVVDEIVAAVERAA